MVGLREDIDNSDSDDQELTGSRVAEPASLSRHDHLLWSIGRVAQAHVVLEMTLRELWASVAETGPDRLGPNQGDIPSFAQVITKLEAAIHAFPGLPDRVSVAATAVLSQARSINRERNRVVHDHWIDVAGALEYRGAARFEGWLRIDPASGVRDITELFSGQGFVDDCLGGLWRVRRAVVILAQLLRHFRPAADADDLSASVEELLQQLDPLTRAGSPGNGASP